MVSHGVWDGANALGDGTPLGLLIAVVLGIVALIVVILMLRKTAPQEHEFLRAILEPEVENGTITQEELDAVCSQRKQRKRFIRSGKGHKSHRSAKHVLRSSLDLAHELAEAGGQDSEGVRHERAEIARFRPATA